MKFDDTSQPSEAEVSATSPVIRIDEILKVNFSVALDGT